MSGTQGQYYTSQLYNGTVTTYQDSDDVVRAIEMNFTGASPTHISCFSRLNESGSAIYIFLAAPSAPSPFDQQCGFALDGSSVGPSLFQKFPASSAHYNILAYASSSIPDGAHTFQIQLSKNTAVNFDYAIYTSVLVSHAVYTIRTDHRNTARTTPIPLPAPALRHPQQVVFPPR
ncbi:hypothetical protein B0H10DRAFT_1420505 [Mycena sp. CBHHK59/15]|nr:hypothetical protein B0H10DRAFT_1420505 [Mycena sp. CBHHK59/15]